ncbi:MAG TPA: hypothetical protein DGG95_10375 [Cytophagales bacterium]|jgi:tetratricopeptide (TPR) repeat protein|nr:hypothetical protein [Cytophagales bacterium]
MKKIIFILFLSPAIAMAQKEIKPNAGKAESALQKGALDEAKSIIDVTVASQEYMVDKKGAPSKNSTKSWYLRGLIYAAIDTSSNPKFKALDANPFAVAKESFEKCNCKYASYELLPGLSKEEVKREFGEPTKIISPDEWVYNGNTVSFKDNKVAAFKNGDKPMNPSIENYVNRLYNGIQLPMSNVEVAKTLAQKYISRGYEAYKKKDYKGAFVDVDKVMLFMPNDTTQLMNAGVYFAPLAGENDKAIEYIKKYIEEGGKSQDATLQLFSIYDKKGDNASAEKFVKQLTSAHPTDVAYLNLEYNFYLKLKNYPEAMQIMQKRVVIDPTDKEARYLMGMLNYQMKNETETMKWMQESVKIDPDYYEPNSVIAQLLQSAAVRLRNERSAITGSKPADLAKRQELRLQIQAKLKETEAYWKKCVDIKPSEPEALDGLYRVYNDLASYDESYEAKINELKKKMKALGMEVD